MHLESQSVHARFRLEFADSGGLVRSSSNFVVWAGARHCLWSGPELVDVCGLGWSSSNFVVWAGARGFLWSGPEIVDFCGLGRSSSICCGLGRSCIVQYNTLDKFSYSIVSYSPVRGHPGEHEGSGRRPLRREQGSGETMATTTRGPHDK